MRITAVFREAFRDVLGGTAKTGLWFGLLAAICVSLVAWEGGTIMSLLTKAERYRESGGSTFVLVAPGFVDGDACDSLAVIPGVLASGAVRDRSNWLNTVALPGRPIPAKDVSGGFASVLGVNGAEGAVVSQEVAETLGLSVGSSYLFTEGRLFVAGVYEYPADGRRSGMGYAILLNGQPSLAYDECWLSVWPQSNELRSAAYSVLRPGAGGSPAGTAYSQLNSRYGQSFEGGVEYWSRISRLSGIAAGVIGFLVGGIMVGRRRLEIAAGRTLGVSIPAQMLIHSLESAVACIMAVVLTSPVAAYFQLKASAGDRAAVATDLALIGWCLSFGCLVGVVVSLCFIRQDSLHQLVKGR